MFLPNVLMAYMSDVRRNTLINICTAALKLSDRYLGFTPVKRANPIRSVVILRVPLGL
jgi:hypothetical protein